MISPTLQYPPTRGEIAEYASMSGRPNPQQAKAQATMRRWIVENGYTFVWSVDSGASVLYPTQCCRMVLMGRDVAVRHKIDFSRYANPIKPLIEAELALEYCNSINR